MRMVRANGMTSKAAARRPRRVNPRRHKCYLRRILFHLVFFEEKCTSATEGDAEVIDGILRLDREMSGGGERTLRAGHRPLAAEHDICSAGESSLFIECSAKSSA